MIETIYYLVLNVINFFFFKLWLRCHRPHNKFFVVIFRFMVFKTKNFHFYSYEVDV